MVTVKRKPGAPKGNKNAFGHGRPPGRKQYYHRQFFGQRWENEVGKLIDEYLQEHGLTQADQVKAWVNRDIVKSTEGNNETSTAIISEVHEGGF